MTEPAGGMNADNFGLLAKVEPGNFWFEPRNRLIIGLINAYFPHATSFMEVGCGTGFVLSAISKSRSWKTLFGSELHEEGLVFAKGRLKDKARLVQMDARNIPAEYKTDLIGAFDVIEHIPEDVEVLQGVHRALDPGGGLIVTVPQHRWLWSHVDEISHHVRRYSEKELREKIEGAGFRVVFSGSYTFALLPLMMLSRFTSAKKDAANNSGDLALPPLLNSLFRTILNGEVALTLAGVSFPVGGSRVMVAIAA